MGLRRIMCSGFLVSYSMKLLQNPGGNAIKTPDIIKPAKEQPRCRGAREAPLGGDTQILNFSSNPDRLYKKQGPAKAEPRFLGEGYRQNRTGQKSCVSFYNGIYHSYRQ